MVFKLQLPQHLVHLTLHLVGFHAVDTSKETNILGNSQIFVEREPLRHIAYVTLNLLIFRADVEAYHPTRSAGGLVQACQHVHRRRLAGTVGTQESEDFASLNAE